MKPDIFSSLISITKGIHRDSASEKEYAEKIKESKINNPQYSTTPLFEIDFYEKPFNKRRTYFKALIDVEASIKFNELIDAFPENAIDAENAFNYNKFYQRFKDNLDKVKSYIDNHNLLRDSKEKENTYVIQYLKANMIWLFVELQDRFSKYGEEPEMTIEDVYHYFFDEKLDDIEIKPSEIGKKEKVVKEVKKPFTAIKDDLPHRTQKDKVLAYSDMVKQPETLARAEEMMFEADLIDRDYNFKADTSKSNKSVLGIIYFLFIEKEYFNKVKTNPFKKIKSTDIVRFLNHRYDTDARKQFKTFENDDERRNEIISKEYLLKNLPNKIR